MWRFLCLPLGSAGCHGTLPESTGSDTATAYISEYTVYISFIWYSSTYLMKTASFIEFGVKIFSHLKQFSFSFSSMLLEIST